MPYRLALGLWLTALLAPFATEAGVLYVPNFSFESQSTSFADPRIDSWQKNAQPPTDTNTPTGWDNLVGVFTNASGPTYIDNANGNQLAYLFADPQVGIFQDFNSTDWSSTAPTHAFNAKYEPGKSYHLKVGLTSSSVEPLTPGATLQIRLYYRDSNSNQVTVAATTVTYDTTVFSNITHLLDFEAVVPTVQTNDAWAGQNIGIQLQSTVPTNLAGGVWDADNIRLTETIAVPNFSFESPVVTSIAGADPKIDSWQKAAQPPTFDTNIFGAWDNLAGEFLNPAAPNTDHIDNADGNQLAYVFGYPQVAIFQDNNSTDWSNGPPSHAFNATFKTGKSYSLTAGFTSSREEPLTQGSTIQMSLYYRDSQSNMVQVAATTVTYDTNVFTNITHLLDFQATIPEVRASDPAVGQHIGIQFQSTVPPNLIGGVWDLDNVRLTEVVATKLNDPARTNGQFNVTLLSEPGLAFEIKTGTNVNQPAASWSSLVSLTNTSGSSLITDPAANLSRRFYRARLLTP